MWLVSAAAILASIPLMGPLRAREARKIRRRHSGAEPGPASA